MKKRYLLMLAVLAAVLLVALPGTAVAVNEGPGPFPITQAHFVSIHNTAVGTETWEVDASAVGSEVDGGHPLRAGAKASLVHGDISVRCSVVPYDGSPATAMAFTVRPEYHFSLDSYSPYTDAGAAAGIAGYVIEASGDAAPAFLRAAPAVGDFYEFYFWDGAQGQVQPDGTTKYYPDLWRMSKVAQNTEDDRWLDIWLRTFGRQAVEFFGYQGNCQWSLSEGDISIRNGATNDGYW